MRSLLNRQTLTVVLFAAGLVFAGPPATAAASPGEAPAPEEPGVSQPGNYLAGLIASADSNSASAETYYREALRNRSQEP